MRTLELTGQGDSEAVNRAARSIRAERGKVEYSLKSLSRLKGKLQADALSHCFRAALESETALLVSEDTAREIAWKGGVIVLATSCVLSGRPLCRPATPADSVPAKGMPVEHSCGSLDVHVRAGTDGQATLVVSGVVHVNREFGNLLGFLKRVMKKNGLKGNEKIGPWVFDLDRTRYKKVS